MKNHPQFKSTLALLIGLAGVAAIGADAWAVDIGAPVLEKWSASKAAPQRQMPAPPEMAGTGTMAPKGAQGPIRTDLSDQMARLDGEAVRRDLQMKRYPMDKGVGIP